MPRLAAPTLFEFLRDETASCESSTLAADHECAAGRQSTTPLRVPLELAGSIWSAEVESVQDRQLLLIVDREAVDQMDDEIEAVIHYQARNGPMQKTTGKVIARGFLSRHRVRLNFELI